MARGSTLASHIRRSVRVVVIQVRRAPLPGAALLADPAWWRGPRTRAIETVRSQRNHRSAPHGTHEHLPPDRIDGRAAPGRNYPGLVDAVPGLPVSTVMVGGLSRGSSLTTSPRRRHPSERDVSSVQVTALVPDHSWVGGTCRRASPAAGCARCEAGWKTPITSQNSTRNVGLVGLAWQPRM